MKNTQLETRYKAGENLLLVDNDNRLYAVAEHTKSIYRIQKKYMECGKMIQNTEMELG